MSQPKWKVISSTDYSRTLVDETGVYPPELEIAQEYSTDHDSKFMLYRIILEKLKLVPSGDRAYLVPETYNESYPHPVSSYEEWFAEDLPKVAKASGMFSSEMEMIDALTSDDVMQRAAAYEEIGNYSGFDNFDSYPDDLTEKQLNKRWK